MRHNRSAVRGTLLYAFMEANPPFCSPMVHLVWDFEKQNLTPMLNERQKSALLYTTFIDSDGKPQKKQLAQLRTG